VRRTGARSGPTVSTSAAISSPTVVFTTLRARCVARRTVRLVAFIADSQTASPMRIPSPCPRSCCCTCNGTSAFSRSFRTFKSGCVRVALHRQRRQVSSISLCARDVHGALSAASTVPVRLHVACRDSPRRSLCPSLAPQPLWKAFPEALKAHRGGLSVQALSKFVSAFS